MSRVHLMIFQTTLLRIYQELKDLLQLSPNVRNGDWYIFEGHTFINIYGF